MADSEAEWIFTVLYAVTIIVSVAGNIILIYIVWKKPEVRSLTSSMFVNMAVADLTVTLVAMPWSIVFFYNEGKWPFTGLLGDITCRAFFGAANITIMASILCLTFMAIDRYYACVWPFSNRSAWFRKTKFVAPLVWILSISLMSIVPVLHDYKNDLCAYNFAMFGQDHTEMIIRAFFCYLFSISYLLPLVVMTVLYTKVAHKIWFRKAPGNQLSQHQQRQEIGKRKVVRMLVIIVATFALCWLPAQCFHLFIGITVFAHPPPYFVMYLVYWLGHANSAINPWLYIRLSSSIKLAFNRMVRRGFSGMSTSQSRKTKSTRAVPLNKQEEMAEENL